MRARVPFPVIPREETVSSPRPPVFDDLLVPGRIEERPGRQRMRNGKDKKEGVKLERMKRGGKG